MIWSLFLPKVINVGQRKKKKHQVKSCPVPRWLLPSSQWTLTRCFQTRMDELAFSLMILGGFVFLFLPSPSMNLSEDTLSLGNLWHLRCATGRSLQLICLLQEVAALWLITSSVWWYGVWLQDTVNKSFLWVTCYNLVNFSYLVLFFPGSDLDFS